MISFREIVTGFRELSLDRSRPMIVHASLSAFGEIRGGGETLLGALTMAVEALMMPAFTFDTLLIPEIGPEDNAIAYGKGLAKNRDAQFFEPNMPVDPVVGQLAELLRRHPRARRSTHPILSFTGIGVEEALQTQTLEQPLAPIGWLTEHQGWVLLLGVDHTVNTSIHYAEKLAGRKQFIRWALTYQGVRECPGFPGCSNGFEQAAPHLAKITRTAQIGNALVRALPLQPMIEIVQGLILKNPLALLCTDEHCERCNAVRQHGGVAVVGQD